MSKINKKPDTELFQISMPDTSLGEFPTMQVNGTTQANEKEEYEIFKVFKFLSDLRLPKEMAARYAHSLKASNPNDQKKLELLIDNILKNKFMIETKDLAMFKKEIGLENNGLKGSLEYYSSIIDFINIVDSINEFENKVKNGILNDE